MEEKTKQKINELKAEGYDNLKKEGLLIQATKKTMAELGTRRQAIAEELKQLEAKDN